MRILLTSNASYNPPRGGSTRSNLVWLRNLVKAGHTVRVVSAAWEAESDTSANGISIRSVKQLALRSAVLLEEIRSFAPDHVLVSSEDLTHTLLREAGRSASIVYLAHTPQFFPFGPESWNPDPEAAALVRDSAAVIAIGHHMAAYIEQHLGRRAAVIHPPIYDAPTPAGSFEARTVLMINPCAVKGIGIFTGLARLFPELPFAGLTGWGTTTEDRLRMSQLPNVRILETVPRIDSVFQNASLLLMPSLWYEGFGLTAMEAMLRGLPVIASDSGGLLEAKGGTGFVIPVNPIRRYLAEFDEVHMPIPALPEQDLAPWAEALRVLTADRDAYRRESDLSRAHSTEFVSQLDPAAFTRLLESLPPYRPDRRALLLARLRTGTRGQPR